jgi:CRP-like cAMP-binding protein
VRAHRVEQQPPTQIFAQGDPATCVMHVEKGAVRLSVLSHAGKEAVVAVLDAGHFFGEGCLAGQMHRMATATAMAPSTILAVEKSEMVRQLHAAPVFADRFLTHMLTRSRRSNGLASRNALRKRRYFSPVLPLPYTVSTPFSVSVASARGGRTRCSPPILHVVKPTHEH